MDCLGVGLVSKAKTYGSNPYHPATFLEDTAMEEQQLYIIQNTKKMKELGLSRCVVVLEIALHKESVVSSADDQWFVIPNILLTRFYQ